MKPYITFLLVLEWDESESSLNIVQNSEEISGLWNADDVHETNWVLEVSSGDSINVNLVGLFLEDDLGLLSSQGILQLSLENQGEWDRLSQFVWSLGWS